MGVTVNHVVEVKNEIDAVETVAINPAKDIVTRRYITLTAL
jgi:ABC-type transporter Mla maintaining outer membrane lipid asymmetry permease subunit MlaE